jgi:ABC-type Fe3+-siderophore transport system permease subunit
LIETVKTRIINFFITIGSVPLFYFILHLILLVLLGFITGFNKYNLTLVYAWFVIIVVILFFLCKWYSKYKFGHPEKKWLKFI